MNRNRSKRQASEGLGKRRSIFEQPSLVQRSTAEGCTAQRSSRRPGEKRDSGQRAARRRKRGESRRGSEERMEAWLREHWREATLKCQDSSKQARTEQGLEAKAHDKRST
eukprot:6210561-Pleurochrysis_carterae.AAC.3